MECRISYCGYRIVYLHTDLPNVTFILKSNQQNQQQQKKNIQKEIICENINERSKSHTRTHDVGDTNGIIC